MFDILSRDASISQAPPAAFPNAAAAKGVTGGWLAVGGCCCLLLLLPLLSAAPLPPWPASSEKQKGLKTLAIF